MIFAAVRYPKRYGYESPLAQHYMTLASIAGEKGDDDEMDRLTACADRAERDYRDAVNIRII